jgi:hypothetical protein
MKTKTNESVVDYWDGILDAVPFADKPYNIFNLISGYEAEAIEVLKSSGYPITVKELLKIRKIWEDKKERRVRDIVRMLTYFREVKIHIDLNNSEGSALSMAFAIQSAMKARIRPVEPKIEIGKKRSAQQKDNRGKRETWGKKTKEEIEKRNEKIIAAWKEYKLSKNSLLSKNSFAKKYSKIHKLSVTQINTIIKNSK